MSFSHANPEPIAEAEVLRLDAEEGDEVPALRFFQLYLDTDGEYRWYEADEASEASGPTMLEALQAAEESWDGFQVVEYRGVFVERSSEIEDCYAADELDELGL